MQAERLRAFRRCGHGLFCSTANSRRRSLAERHHSKLCLFDGDDSSSCQRSLLARGGVHSCPSPEEDFTSGNREDRILPAILSSLCFIPYVMRGQRLRSSSDFCGNSSVPYTSLIPISLGAKSYFS